MKALTAEQMRETDRLTTERYGIPSLQLMENAGKAITGFIVEKFRPLAGKKIVALCGKGNNGGDGLVVARCLRETGCSPEVILFSSIDAVGGDAAINLKRWRESQGEIHVVTNEAQWEFVRGVLDEADLLLDALLGTGLRGPADGLLVNVIGDINAARGRRRGTRRPAVIVAVDTPSGLNSDAVDFGGQVVQADFTVTLTAPKVGQLVSPRAASCGTFVVRTIGTPPDLLESNPKLKIHMSEPGEFRCLPLWRDPASHKGTYGHALIIAGSLGKSGAAILAARGALRSGAGLVTVATPETVLPIVAGGMPEMMTVPLAVTEAGTASRANFDSGRFAEAAMGKTVLAMGPGLSTHTETQEFIRAVVRQTELPLILDADGLNAFGGITDNPKERRTSLVALTPHPGEMGRLIGTGAKEVQARRLDVAVEAAARWRAYVILKGFHSILATPSGEVYVNTTGNPGMATGGTGDVLTGILAGLTAQFGTKDWSHVLGMGVYLHGLAGDVAAERVGQASLVATDLIESIPAAYERILAGCDHGC